MSESEFRFSLNINNIKLSHAEEPREFQDCLETLNQLVYHKWGKLRLVVQTTDWLSFSKVRDITLRENGKEIITMLTAPIFVTFSSS